MKEILKMLIAYMGQYISGEKIGAELGISRAAVSKGIAKLKDAGYPIVSSTNSGHCLTGLPDVLDEYILGALTSLDVKVLDECESTNTLAKKEANNYDAIAAIKQTGGRGRRGRQFLSSEGGAYFSLIARPKLMSSQVMLINLAAAIAVYEALQKLGLSPFLKYPNDIFVNGKKICGILSETLSDGDYLEWAVIGIGININNDIDEEIKDIAISIKQILGQEISRAKLIADIILSLSSLLDSPESIVKKYKTLCSFLGETIKIIGDKESFEAMAVDIDENGFLTAQKDGKIIIPVGCDVSVKMRV